MSLQDALHVVRLINAEQHQMAAKP